MGLRCGLSGEEPELRSATRATARSHFRRARAVASWDLADARRAPGRGPRTPPASRRWPTSTGRLLPWLSAARSCGCARGAHRDQAVTRSTRACGRRARGTSPAVRALLGWLDRVGYGGLVKAVSSMERAEPLVDGGIGAGGRRAPTSTPCAPSASSRGARRMAGELADRPVTPEFLSRYLAGIGPPAPRVWGWHAYEDAWDRQRDSSFPRLRTLLGAIAPNAEVWLTEQGGIVRRRMPGDDGARRAGRRRTPPPTCAS